MLSSMLRTFAGELDIFAGALAADAARILTAEEHFVAQQIDVEWANVRVNESSRHHGLVDDARSSFEIKTCTIIRHNGRRERFERSSEPVFLGGLPLPQHNLIAIAAALAGYRVRPAFAANKSVAAEFTLARMLRLRSNSMPILLGAPEAVAEQRSARGLEQAMTAVQVERLANPEMMRRPDVQSRRVEIMDRFHDVIANAGGDVLPIPEVCAAVDVPQRTLHLCCRDSLGVSPKTYLQLRRMHLARRMLTRSNAFTMTVTETAAHFGFWNFGRFSAQYRQLFGETPSQTLRSMKIGGPVMARMRG
jgi:AraC-like DNA-binding protein